MDLHLKRTLLVVGLLWGVSARADLFSPGELAKPHAGLEGLSQCTKCHPAGGKLSQETCLACHAELQPRLGQGKGLHGHLTQENRNCEACHHEHQGVEAKLIDYGAGGEKGFNHQRAGWPLKGAHAEAKCAACHEKRLILWPTAQKLLETRPHTMLGLGQGCTDCHFDEHRGQQKEDCEFCHAEKAWKPAQGFKHDNTAYPLKGKHVTVKCTGCHEVDRDSEAHGFPAPKNETFLRFAPVEFKACTDCHKDPHDNRFGPRCLSCHTVEGWKIIHSASAERAFHEKTKFPLKGAHVDVECQKCHGPFPGQAAKFKGLAFDTCATCHVDAHEGQLAADGVTPDCGKCHTEQSFTPARFGAADHAATRYPLEGAHQVVACAACHPATPALKLKVPKNVLAEVRRKRLEPLFSAMLFDYTKPLERCDSCHTDAHQGQFKGQACERCHQVASFTQVRFDHQKDSRFKLDGAHARVACAKCHWAASPTEVVRYKPLDTDCESCHADPHAGQFEKKACESCHQTQAWKTLRFQHQPPFTRFLLDGAHQQAKCESCHVKVKVGPSAQVARYRPLPQTCEGCHSDFHQGAFKGFEP